MAKAFIDDANLTAIADAIRAQNGSTDTYLPSEMAAAIEELPVLDTSDATASDAVIVSGKTAYINGEKVEGAMPILQSHYTVDSSMFNNTNNFQGGLLYVPLSNCSEYPVVMFGMYGAAGQSLTVDVPGSYLGDASIADVVSGKTFTSSKGLKITGTATLGTDTSDATATEEQIISGATAYVNGAKITGTLVLQNYYTGTTTPESTTGGDGDLYFKVTR